MQIRNVIVEKTDKYNIKNPEIMIKQIQELHDGDLEPAVRTVIDSLINRKNFKAAKEICDKYSHKEKEQKLIRSMRSLRIKIRNAEIGDIILKAINMNGTAEEEKAYFELIENGLKMGNVKLNSVFIGKSQDGLSDIYLSDIFGKKEKVK